MYICIYIYIERERDRERKGYIYTYTCMFIHTRTHTQLPLRNLMLLSGSRQPPERTSSTPAQTSFCGEAELCFVVGSCCLTRSTLSSPGFGRNFVGFSNWITLKKGEPQLSLPTHHSTRLLPDFHPLFCS